MKLGLKLLPSESHRSLQSRFHWRALTTDLQDRSEEKICLKHWMQHKDCSVVYVNSAVAIKEKKRAKDNGKNGKKKKSHYKKKKKHPQTYSWLA